MVYALKKWYLVPSEQWREVKTKEKPDVIVGLFHSGWDGGIKTPEYDEDASKKVAKEVAWF